MSIKYMGYNEIPNMEALDGIISLHQRIFGESNDLAGRMMEKPKLRLDIAMDGEKVIGYKIGYALNREQFYSWLGGVDPDYRNTGIASNLMDQQHQYLMESGYKAVQTRTKNKWRSMLILNIKCGFDIIGTFTDNEGEPKIILEKKLAD
ncbi:ribosomal protein S18 acetylase RimI-like enzyme [Cytobacillus eiseniae]|uniref:Ribosomal protein S18 acetylase RimI-like enzyme n=1 Tax=Cytobacillus eiseniae TaxID=762947 RepID=A0ABS4RF75_9BACI|nr:GNAT family N-acetyltransferase [Cytobacillus eiseniae]MBP2241550.1 ribosomal protein S18 acetylase RimI-like enzyme [Cytobacillus eiseniae]